jgi:Flp pilus assembly protein TadD
MVPFPTAPRFLATLAAFALAGCATTGQARRDSARELFAQADAQQVTLENPVELSPPTFQMVQDQIGTYGSSRDKLRRITRFLLDTGRIDFQYSINSSLTAEQAFHEKHGDCVSYANLYVAIARAVGLPVSFVRVTDLPVFYEAQGTFFMSSHMAVGYGEGRGTQLVMDFSTEQDDWRLGYYQEIDDKTAAVLFNENLAVEKMLAGEYPEAEKRLRFLITHAPELPELVSNLGVLLMRQGRANEAVALLEGAAVRFPEYHPLLVNAAQAERLLGQADKAEALEARASRIAGKDPFLQFSKGLTLYQRDDFDGAARQFHQALSEEPDNLVLLAWAARAHLAAGEKDQGKALFSRMLKIAPRNAKVLADLLREFPTLHGVSTDPNSERAADCRNCLASAGG